MLIIITIICVELYEMSSIIPGTRLGQGKLILAWSVLEDTSNYIIGNNRGGHATAVPKNTARGWLHNNSTHD